MAETVRELASFGAEVVWTLEGDFIAGKYSRGHLWRFDGGTEVEASASPHVVPLPYSREDAVDPEEAYLASLSSCHMLWFLDFARKAGFEVVRYRDRAWGRMVRDAGGRVWFDRVTLVITAEYGALRPDRAAEEALHDQAHHACFIANSVKTEIEVRIVEVTEAGTP